MFRDRSLTVKFFLKTNKWLEESLDLTILSVLEILTSCPVVLYQT